MSESPIRRRIEEGFVSWGRLVVRWRWIVIAACGALTFALAVQLPDLRVDNSDQAFLSGRDDVRIAYERFKDQFGRDDPILIVLRPAEVFDLQFFETLRRLQSDIDREVPYVEEVTSLINARNTRGEGDELIVEELMADWPQNDDDVRRLRKRVFANPLFVNILVSQDGEYATLTVKPFTYSTTGPEQDALQGFEDPGVGGGADEAEYLTSAESIQQVTALRAVLARYAGPDLEIYPSGGPVFEERMFSATQRDAVTQLTLSSLMIMGLLFVLFRRISGVVLPLAVIFTATASALGFMVWVDIPYSITLNMVPLLLMVVGVCDSVHILTITYQQLAAGRSKRDSIAFALGHSGLAVVMTSVTTAAGFSSFQVAEIAPIAQLGVVAPAGVMLAMVFSISLLPALLAVSPLKSAPRKGGISSRGILDRFLAGVGDLSTRHPRRIVIVSGLLVAIALPGVLALRFSHDPMLWFPDEEPARIAVQLLDSEFKGADALEVVIRTGVENGLHDPANLRRIESAMRRVETLEVGGHAVNKAISLVDVVKETHQALNENRRDFYILPDDRQLIAQELLLFENSGSDDLEDVTDTRFEMARMTVRAPSSDALLYGPFLDEVDANFGEILGDLEFELTGGPVLFSRIFDGLVTTLARSYVFALAVITPIMVLLIGSLRRGLVAMIPNLIPVYGVLALMGYAGIPLGASTLLIGGIIIGLAVDDTIHFMHKFGRYYEDSGDPVFAVHETLATTGAALLFTSLVLTCGFAIFMTAYMRNTFWFGLLTSTGTLMAFAADIILAPALMVLVSRRRPGAAVP